VCFGSQSEQESNVCGMDLEWIVCVGSQAEQE
jgi:hypothetical protein